MVGAVQNIYMQFDYRNVQHLLASGVLIIHYIKNFTEAYNIYTNSLHSRDIIKGMKKGGEKQ